MDLFNLQSPVFMISPTFLMTGERLFFSDLESRFSGKLDETKTNVITIMIHKWSEKLFRTSNDMTLWCLQVL